MEGEDLSKETILNVLKERPELLQNLNVVIAKILDQAQVDPSEISMEDLLDALSSALDHKGD